MFLYGEALPPLALPRVARRLEGQVRHRERERERERETHTQRSRDTQAQAQAQAQTHTSSPASHAALRARSVISSMQTREAY
eukprot:1986483-Rhodomonas_salina.3